MDGDEGVGYFDGRDTVQHEWFSVGPPLPGVRRVCCTFMSDLRYFTIRDAKWAVNRVPNVTWFIGSTASQYQTPYVGWRISLKLAAAEFACIAATSKFPDRDIEPTTVRSSSVATQQYQSSTGSWASTVCVYLDDFNSDCSVSLEISSPVPAIVVDRGVVSL